VASGLDSFPVENFPISIAFELRASEGPIFVIRHLSGGTAAAFLAPIENHVFQGFYERLDLLGIRPRKGGSRIVHAGDESGTWTRQRRVCDQKITRLPSALWHFVPIVSIFSVVRLSRKAMRTMTVHAEERFSFDRIRESTARTTSFANSHGFGGFRHEMRGQKVDKHRNFDLSLLRD
jgi:hypothetical protein